MRISLLIHQQGLCKSSRSIWLHLYLRTKYLFSKPRERAEAHHVLASKVPIFSWNITVLRILYDLLLFFFFDIYLFLVIKFSFLKKLSNYMCLMRASRAVFVAEPQAACSLLAHWASACRVFHGLPRAPAQDSCCHYRMG